MSDTPITNYKRLRRNIRRAHIRLWLKHEGPFVLVCIICVVLIGMNLAEGRDERSALPWLNDCVGHTIKRMSSTDGSKQTMTISCEVRK